MTIFAAALALAACETPPTKEQKGTVAGALESVRLRYANGAVAARA